MSHAALARSLAAGLLFVAAADGGDRAIGFLAAGECDGALMVAEIDVERRRQGRGVGRALMEHALAEARRRGLWGAMLTTDRLAPFNRRFYASMGFVVGDTVTLPPALRTALANEVAAGLDPNRRVGMILSFA
jgi:GNAT superfamily N-acetyltransferase